MNHNASILFCALLAVGCASQTPPRQTHLIPPASETSLTGMRLGSEQGVNRIASGVRRLVAEDMRFWAAKAGVLDTAVDMRLATVGDLKKDHIFTNSFLSDDTQVVVASSEGRFEVGDIEDKVAP
ncbi:MAG: hypothetical protein FJZ00_12180, partial [Candidatus Sericytochromatia bacterium]|nr:hypothetical protein [Candidatus Tanganyikabacteria bacterium]